MKKSIKLLVIGTLVALPILGSLIVASGAESCADYFTGQCVQVSINGGETFPVCFEDHSVIIDEC